MLVSGAKSFMVEISQRALKFPMVSLVSSTQLFVQVLVSGILERLEVSFRTMQSINWAGFTTVGEERYSYPCSFLCLFFHGLSVRCSARRMDFLLPPTVHIFCFL